MSVRQRKILFIISGLGVGGAEKLLINLANRFDKSRFHVEVVALSDRNTLAKEICSSDVRFTSLPRGWRYDLRPARQIRHTIATNDIDAVIAFDLFSYFYVRVALLGISPRPGILVSLHSTAPKSLKHFLQSMTYARLLSGNVKLISVCEGQADYLSKIYGIPRKRFTTVYNGVDVEHFRLSEDPDARNSIRSSMMLPGDAFVILQVASLAPHKCHEDSFAALQDLADRNPQKQCYLLLVGQGPKEREDDLRALAEKLKVSDLVRFCGLQSDVRPFYQAADVFTLSSRSIETFSVAALEAMSMGLPCVITDIGGAREMIVEGMNGFVVPPRDPHALAGAWLKIIDGRETLGHEKIRAWVVEHFSLVDCVKRYESLAA